MSKSVVEYPGLSKFVNIIIVATTPLLGAVTHLLHNNNSYSFCVRAGVDSIGKNKQEMQSNCRKIEKMMKEQV